MQKCVLLDKIVNEVQTQSGEMSRLLTLAVKCDKSLCIDMCTNAIAIRTPVKL